MPDLRSPFDVFAGLSNLEAETDWVQERSFEEYRRRVCSQYLDGTIQAGVRGGDVVETEPVDLILKVGLLTTSDC